MPESEDTVWLTQEAFDKLTQELEYLKGEGRTAIANKIADARSEGDLSENLSLIHISEPTRPY